MPPTRQSQLVPLLPFPPYRARYFLDFCFRSNSDTPSPTEVTRRCAARFTKMYYIYRQTTVSSRDIEGIEKKISFSLALCNFS